MESIIAKGTWSILQLSGGQLCLDRSSGSFLGGLMPEMRSSKSSRLKSKGRIDGYLGRYRNRRKMYQRM